MKKKRKEDTKKEEKKEKNFCDACGLFIDLEEESLSEEEFLEKLKTLGLRKKGRFGKKVFYTYGGPRYTKICVLGSKNWRKNGNRRVLWMKKRCEDFQLGWLSFKLSDYISIYTAKRISRTANKLAIIVIAIAVAALLLVLFAAEVKCFLESLF